MTIEAEIAALTEATTDLLEAVNVSKATLDAAVAATAADVATIDAQIAIAESALQPGDPIPIADVTGLQTALDGKLNDIPRAVTWPKVQAVATGRFLGRLAAGAGDVEELTATQAGVGLGIYAQAASRSGKDANGIFTTVQYRRANNTLIRSSVLSGGTSPAYTTRTETLFDVDGSTVLQTLVFTLGYTNGELTSEDLL
jgi:hypothetical protein